MVSRIDGPVVLQEIDFRRMEVHGVWKNMVLGFSSVKLTVSPSVTGTAGPGIWPLNVRPYILFPFLQSRFPLRVQSS